MGSESQDDKDASLHCDNDKVSGEFDILALQRMEQNTFGVKSSP
jgi:hypothetical protein